ncbi:MAG: carboxymuconolactone decarboxylase family protein [Chloroflexi bacterium]|nr:MAG: carboxymuconolactone decarboxylase family protein [Chloroflexota bacterium]
MSKLKFTRRYYNRPSDLLRDIRQIMGKRKFIRKVMREIISHDFRERLMMVVTEVNGCRYCRSYHLKESLKSGVSEAELADLLKGYIPKDTPPEEYVALAYAQNWAENNANPDPETWAHLVETYGNEKAEAIQLVLQMIRMGNLSGNLLDYLIFKLSFGRHGLVENEARFSIME